MAQFSPDEALGLRHYRRKDTAVEVISPQYHAGVEGDGISEEDDMRSKKICTDAEARRIVATLCNYVSSIQRTDGH